MKNHRVVVTRQGGPDVLQLVQELLPEPRTGEVLVKVLAAGRIKSVVAERIPLAEAARAHERLERGGHAGKVVLVAGLEGKN
jgi:NADPH:quinone reductase-like Zn-dependent oxidoreductase